MTTWSSIGGFADIGVVHPAVNLTDKMRLIDSMALTEPNWVRTICAWNYITKTRDPGAAVASPPSYGFSPHVYAPPTTVNRDWSSLDTCVNEILRRIPGVRPQLIIGQGKPKWSGFVSAPNYADYGNFCVEVVNRYGPGGLGIAPDLRSAGRVVMDFEIWNEQNNKGFWTWGNVNPKGYVQMITDAYTKIKAAQPSVTVVFGSYQHVSRTGPWYGYGWMTQPEIEWWQECFDNGLGNVFDAVGVHPYSIGDYEYGLGPLEPSLTESDAWLQFQELRDLLVAKGYGDKPWRITEIGYPTSMCSEAQQVQFHHESMGFLDDFPFVEAYMIYCCRNDGTDLTDKEQSLGAMYGDFTPKLLYFDLQAQNGVVIQPPPMRATANTSAPTLRTDITLNATPMTATAAMPDSRVLANVLIAPTMRATAAMPAPTVHLSTSATAPAMTATTNWPPPMVLVNNPPPIHNVVVDSSGPGVLVEATNTISENYEIPASGLLGAYLLVGLVLSHSFQIGYAGLGGALTVGGTPMTLLGATDIGSYKEGSVHWYGLANPPSGPSVTITRTVTGATMRGMMLCPALLEGVLGIGDIVTNKSQNFWTVRADVVSDVNDRVFLLVGGGKQVTSCTGEILYNDGDAAITGQGSFMMMATAPSDGDGSTNITATQGSAPYGMVGIQVQFDPSLAVLQVLPLPMAAVGALSVPAIHSGATVTAAPFTATAAMPAPAVGINLTVTAPPMTATAALRNPAVNLTVTAPPMTATANLVAPAVSISDSVTAVHFAATAAMPAPVVTSGYVITPPAFAATANVPAPAVSSSVVITAPPMTATANMTNPAVASGLVVAAVPMTATAAAAAPAVSTSGTVTAAPFTATADAPTPVVSSTRNITVTAVPFTATAAAPVPAVSTSGSVTAVPFTATAAAAAPALSIDYSVTGVAFAAAAAMPAPVVSTAGGPITITAPPMTATAGVAVPVLKIAYDLAFSGSTLPTSGITGVPIVVSHAAASGNTVAVPTHQAGDLIYYCAFRDGSATLPTADANYLSYKTQTGTTCSMRVSVRKATTSSEAAGTFTNATEVVCVVVRGADNPMGTSTTGTSANAAGGSGTGGTITYPACTFLRTDSTSVGLRFAGQRDATNMTTNAPSGYSQVDGVATGVCAVLATATSSSPASGTQSTNGTTGWCAITLELVAATVSFGTSQPVSVSSSTMREGQEELAVNGDYYEAWLHPSPMNTDVYTGRANSGALTTGSGRGMGFCCGVPDGTAPFTKALIGIMDQQTAAGARIMTWDGATWTPRASATGTGTSAGTSDDVGIRISKSGGIYTYTLQKNQVDTSVSWTDSGNVFGTPGPRWGAAFHNTRVTGVPGGSPGVDEIWSADT